MPRLLNWCDEASIAHWTDEHTEMPSTEIAFERMRRDGRVSKVHNPSARQARGETVGQSAPRIGMKLSPKEGTGQRA
jgi:hypothetical protein